MITTLYHLDHWSLEHAGLTLSNRKLVLHLVCKFSGGKKGKNQLVRWILLGCWHA